MTDDIAKEVKYDNRDNTYYELMLRQFIFNRMFVDLYVLTISTITLIVMIIMKSHFSHGSWIFRGSYCAAIAGFFISIGMAINIFRKNAEYVELCIHNNFAIYLSELKDATIMGEQLKAKTDWLLRWFCFGVANFLLLNF